MGCLLLKLSWIHESEDMVLIREATKLDREKILDIHIQAFETEEAKKVAALASNLLSEDTHPKTLINVAEINGKVVGHIAFSPVTFNSNKNLKGYILAPLGVKPEYQKRRIGSKLIKNGIEMLSREGVNVLFVYGDPKYYSKFGFNEKAAAKYTPPYKLQYPFGWLAITLDKANSTQDTVLLSCVDSLSDPTLW